MVIILFCQGTLIVLPLVLEEFYNHVLNGTIDKLHIPHSDVFYVREAVQNHYGRKFTLEHVEWAMRMEGWTDE